MADARDTYDLGAAWRALRPRWWLIAGLTALVAITAATATATRSDSYEATSVLLFRNPKLASPAVDLPNVLGGEPTIDADTNVGLVSLDAVAETVVETSPELTAVGADELADAVTVAEGAGPELVEITAEAGRPQAAATIANAYAKGFAELRREADREDVRAARRAAVAELRRMTPSEREGPEGIELRERIGNLRALELLQTGNVEIVEEADPPSAPSGGSVARSTALGGLAGLILGLAAALLLERLDRRLRSGREIEAAFGAPVLASVPPLPEGSPISPAQREPLRSLATAVRHLDRERDLRSILLLPCTAGAGASSLALALARSAAADGADVALVEADLRSPTLAARCDAERSPGLTELLRGDVGLRQASRELPGGTEGWGELTLVPAGAGPASPAVLEGPPLAEVLADLGAANDLVLVDAPPLGEVADAVPLLGIVDGVVVVCGPQERYDDALELRKRLREFDAPLTGVVVAGAAARRGQ